MDVPPKGDEIHAERDLRREYCSWTIMTSLEIPCVPF